MNPKQNKILPAVLAATMILLFSACKEECLYCEVLGHREIYIPEVCGDDEFRESAERTIVRLHAPNDVRCVTH